MMNVLSGANKFLESKATAATVFAVTGLSKLASDYKDAPTDKKHYTLTHDAFVLGVSALGVAGYTFASKKVIKSKGFTKLLNKLKTHIKGHIEEKKYSKPAKNVLNYLKEVSTKCLDNTLMLGTGILGAIGADYLVHAVHLDKKLKQKRTLQTEDKSFNRINDTTNTLINSFKESGLNKTLDNAVGSEVKNSMYNRIFDFPAMRMFTTSMVGMQGFEVIQEKTLKARMMHTTKCLIANSVVPIFFLSTATSLTKKMNSALRLPLTFATMIFGTMYTNKLIDKHQYKDVRKNAPKSNMDKTKPVVANQTSKSQQNIVATPVQPLETQSLETQSLETQPQETQPLETQSQETQQNAPNKIQLNA